MSHLARAKTVFDIEIAALKRVRTQLDGAFDRAIQLMAEALGRRGKIVVVGIGKSGPGQSTLAIGPEQVHCD